MDAPTPKPTLVRRMGLRAWLALVLFAWAAATYAPIVTHEFVSYDDPSYVTNNATVKAGLTWRGVAWAFTTGHASNWHPLTWLSHMADVELFGLWAGGHHLGNLLLHAVNTVLVFLAFDRLVRVGWTRLGATDDERRRLAWQAATVAALFATHPLHVESVAWVAERKDTLSTLFWLLAMIAYAGYAARPGIVRYLAVAACLALGLLAKPMLVTLPCVLLLLDYWPLGRWQPPDWLAPRPAGASAGVPLWKLVVEKLPLVAIVVASALETMLVQRLGGALKSEAAYPWNVRIWNALFSYARYLLKTVFPENLSFFYPYPRKLLDRGFSEPRLLAALALLIVATALCLGLGRRRRYLAVGWLWYVGTLVPVVGLVQVGDQALADRYTYVPLLGIFVILAWGLPDLLDALATTAAARRRGDRVLLALTLLVIAVCTVLTWRQQSHWRNNLAFYHHGIALDPANYVAQNNLALVLSGNGDHNGAIRHYQLAIEANPRYVIGHFNMGVEWERLKRADEAEKQYRRAIEFNAGYTKATHNLAALLAKQGRLAEAEPLAVRAVREWPRSAVAARTYGTVLLRQGRAAEALAEFDRAAIVEPNSAEAQGGRGLALLRLGRDDEAREALHRALELKKDYPEPHIGLGDLAAKAEYWDQAAIHYEQALRFLPVAAEAARKLAEIELRRGNPAQAATWYEKSLEHDPNDATTRAAYAQVLDGLGRAQEAAEQRKQAAQGSK